VIRISFWPLVIVAAIGFAVPATAQQTTPPRTGGLFGGRRAPDPTNADRALQQLSFRLDLAGGYDEQRGAQLITSEFTQAGTIGSSGAEIHHRWGRSRTYLDSFVRGHVAFADVGLSQQKTGASQVLGEVALGKRAGLSMRLSAAYQPTYLFNAFGPVAASSAAIVPAEMIPGAELSEGFTEQRWLATGGTTQFHRNWTPRQRTDVHYNASRRTLMRATDVYSESQAGGFRHDWSYRERVGVVISYQLDRTNERANDGTLHQPLEAHRAEIGLRAQRRFPTGRTLSVSAIGGATRSQRRATDTVPGIEFVAPTMGFAVHSQTSTRWAWSIDGRRHVTMLEGLTPRPFVTDVASLSLHGRFGRFVELTSTAAYSHGVEQHGTAGEFETSLGNVEVLFPLGRIVSMMTSYTYYDHQFINLPEVQLHLPPNQRRHSVRAGVRLWLPLFGTF
jgi:hypothetical protein